MANILSTSNCGTDVVKLFGFGAVNAEGFGLGYMTLDNYIPVTVTDYQGNAENYKNELEKVLLELQQFLESGYQ